MWPDIKCPKFGQSGVFPACLAIKRSTITIFLIPYLTYKPHTYTAPVRTDMRHPATYKLQTQTHDLGYIQRAEWPLGQADAAGSIGVARFPPFRLHLATTCPYMAMYLFLQNENTRIQQRKCKLQCNYRQQDVL